MRHKIGLRELVIVTLTSAVLHFMFCVYIAIVCLRYWLIFLCIFQ